MRELILKLFLLILNRVKKSWCVDLAKYTPAFFTLSYFVYVFDWLVIFYRNNLNIIKNITPGTPKKPAIKAVIQLMPIKKLKYPPIKLTIKSSTTPSSALTNNLKNILIGQVNTFITKNRNTSASKKYPMYSIVHSPP